MAETKEMQNWLRREAARRMGRDAAIRDEVERQMHSCNLRIEGKNDKGLWDKAAMEEDDNRRY
jgi:hypothetical protein